MPAKGPQQHSFDLKQLWAEAKENQERLKKCSGPHKFEPISDKPFAGYRCTTCGGTVDAHAARWYAIGISHGKYCC